MNMAARSCARTRSPSSQIVCGFPSPWQFQTKKLIALGRATDQPLPMIWCSHYPFEKPSAAYRVTWELEDLLVYSFMPCGDARLREDFWNIFHVPGWGRTSLEIIDMGNSVKVGLRTFELVECLGSCERRWSSGLVNFLGSHERKWSFGLVGLLGSCGRG